MIDRLFDAMHAWQMRKTDRELRVATNIAGAVLIVGFWSAVAYGLVLALG